ncbi:16S rRNA (guanine(527)-N(7))-methyltransferase RsmG [Mycoplasma seminis]|uniref:Ribosomal RNA small subunit methyltransferase G n=1 Tax=Mycoplasma seminis TaxID=512749 RepID=A0ABY9HA81_9MOLU|nr:16S rRNA (guanine(527)-N(7))-methyltransferase RsmG [Mycoplasma seminis]WLP85406.1 16S rRNA (guanine(527)-N(7))-methyltransferase RsmG [Mycoplasma seminis]
MEISKKQIVADMCKQNNWDFSLFEKYVNLIEEKNKVMNLTGFSGERLWEEGILESLEFMLQITQGLSNGSILDIGAGAGFPSIPYVLTKPNNKVTIYEPIQKRVNFLNEVINALNLQEYVTVYTLRAEDIKEKNIFDIVTARAVADVRSLLMAAFHLVKVNGKMILMKSNKVYDELETAKSILAKLDYELELIPFNKEEINRNNIILSITKKRSTPPQFPYLWKDIKKA